jgi:hypothetical protein
MDERFYKNAALLVNCNLPCPAPGNVLDLRGIMARKQCFAAISNREFVHFVV